MIKITDSTQHAKSAKLNENDEPIKVIADHFHIIHYTWDKYPTPHIIATCEKVTESGEKIDNTFTQFMITDEKYDYLMNPSEEQLKAGRKAGNFRVEDIEDCIVNFGDFPGAINLAGKVELVKNKK